MVGIASLYILAAPTEVWRKLYILTELPLNTGDETPFKYLKMVVNATNNGSVFWTMGKFKFYTYEAIDPEIPAQDGVDE